MARRSPMNERYQKTTAPGGKTRRSAASAKPKRDLAGESSSKSSSSKKSPGSSKQSFTINPPTEEFRRWRRVWWILLLSSLVFTLGSVAIQYWLAPAGTDGSDPWTVAGRIMLGLGYGGIFAALYIDWTKLRRMRREWAEQQKSGKVPKTEKPATGKHAAEDDSGADKS